MKTPQHSTLIGFGIAGCLIVIAVCFVLSLPSCTDAEWDRYAALGDEHHITLYSGGIAVRSWTSTGKVKTEANSDGYYFRDKDTQRLVWVTSDLVIEVVE